MKGLKKCVIFLGIVKEEIAGKVFSFFSEKEKEKILTEIEKGENISKSEKNKTLLEVLDYFKKLKTPVVSLEISSIILIFTLIFASAFLYLISGQIRRSKIEQVINLFASTGGIYFFTYPYLSYFTRKKYGKSPIGLIFTKKNIFVNIFFGLTGALLLFVLLAAINKLVDSRNYNKGFIFYLMIVSQVYFVPVTEEVIFRRFLFIKLAAEYNKTISLIIVSLAFTFVHLPQSIVVGLLYFISGLVLTGLYALRNSLLPSFLAHCIANLAFYLTDFI